MKKIILLILSLYLIVILQAKDSKRLSGAIGSQPKTELNTKIYIYPDSVMDVFQIRGIEGATTCWVYDLNKNLLFRKEIFPNEFISTKTFPKGNYLVRINIRNRLMEMKLVKK